MKKNIALMAGGYSGEYSVSLEGAKQIEDNLKEDYNIYKIKTDGFDTKDATSSNVSFNIGAKF